ncbi:extensin-like domain-containing protein [Pseudomonas mangrovi]|uniref:Extensin n=1 Tax=Pseudomonas mangrovi TaxID=2161748 RepID=A0A2T5PED6_9PSED|nr:extensin family protein [Pseudomonas mangrovi]PTU76091.1 extensin [Pseudomonas mangrovi]
MSEVGNGSARGFLLFLLLLALAAAALLRGWVEIPPRWNPWAPLDLGEPPNFLSGFKMARLRDDPRRCLQALETSQLRFDPVADSLPAPGCPLENSVRLRSSDTLALGGDFLASCPLAAAFALFEEHGLQPAADAVYGQPVVRIEHYGSFACRNIGGSSRRSQHASANALDIAGFRLRDGTRITLARDWNGSEREQRFLRQVRDAACGPFNAVLGPEYNAAHHDHLHLDMGTFRICR